MIRKPSLNPLKIDHCLLIIDHSNSPVEQCGKAAVRDASPKDSFWRARMLN